MKFTIRTFLWLLIVVAIIVATAVALIPKPVDVETAAVVEGPLRVSVREDGKTRIREKYIVSAPVSGRLSRIKLKEGDVIDGDRTLIAVILPSEPAILDARSRAEAKARVHATEASLRRAEASEEQAAINHDLTKSKYERAEKLFSKQAISRDEYDIAKADHLAAIQATKTGKFETEIAQFELQMAQAAADQFGSSGTSEGGTAETSEESVEPFEIFSPVLGKVLNVFQESSTVVSVGAPLLEIGDPRNLEIEIDVLSTDATRIRPGAEISIEHWGGESPLKGNVRVIEPAAFTKISSLGVEEQRVNIIADFQETPERIATLGDGYRVEARITIDEQSNVLQVPNSSLFRYQRQWHVMKVVSNKAVLQSVSIGLQNESVSQITQGLNQGDTVILYPSDQVSSGTVVRPSDIAVPSSSLNSTSEK